MTAASSEPSSNARRHPRVFADIDKAIALNPWNALAYFHRGYAYEKKGDEDRAIADFRRALEINPRMLDAKVRLKRLGATP